MIPIPQYPLYSAALAEYDAYQVGYYLDEDKTWAVTTEELNRAYESAKGECIIRAIVVINPGNPTGQVLNADNITNIIRFANERNLVVLADEVYQDNIYIPGMKFVSFRKIMLEMPEPYKKTQLASFHSASKGYMGECGARAGYFEVNNFDDAVLRQLQKLISTNLCPPVWGQALMDLVVSPPKPGDPSYDSFIKEKAAALEDLRKKAEMVTASFNKIKGIHCNPIQGAMYAFPRLLLPKKFVHEAESRNKHPDSLYCLKLLESTGICVVPGSGFGQKEGTFHFRTTILPDYKDMRLFLQRLEAFQNEFFKQYS